MRKIELVIPGEPVAQPRYVQTQTKSGRPINLIRKKANGQPHPIHAYKADIQAAFLSHRDRWPSPKKELRAAWVLDVVAIFQGKGLAEGQFEPYNLRGRNDGDNVLKAIKDALNVLAWYDDGEVISERILRVKGWQPKTIIRITEFEGSTVKQFFTQNCRCS